MYTMDGLLGLPRKKSAGISHRGPLYEKLFFQDQSEVDSFVCSSASKKTTYDVRVIIRMQ